jgi:hypothetical protein
MMKPTKEQYWITASGYWVVSSKINRIQWGHIDDDSSHLWDYRGESSHAKVPAYNDILPALKSLKLAIIKRGIGSTVRVSHVQYRYYVNPRSGWGRHRSINDFKPINL